MFAVTLRNIFEHTLVFPVRCVRSLWRHNFVCHVINKISVDFYFVHLFSYPLFFWESRRGSTPGRNRNSSRSTAISGSSPGCTLKTGPGKVEDVNKPSDPWSTFWANSPWVSPAGLASPIFPGTFWTPARTNVGRISRFGQVVRYSVLYEFHSCVLCHEVSHCELCKNRISATCTWDITLTVITHDLWPAEVMIWIKTDLKTDSFSVFETSRFVTTER